MIDETRMIDALLPRVAGHPGGMLHLAQRMNGRGQRSRAAALCVDLLDLPDVPRSVAVRAQAIIAGSISGFHHRMVLDHIRNQAYEAALARTIRPGMRVLEIGTGAGLLAMMAVRAGAGHVYTCEVDPLLALVATDIIAVNGLSDRITVITRHSSMLDAVTDLGGRADLLVSEIIGDRLINEGVLASHAHAVDTLLVPGAPVIPLRGSIRTALVDLAGGDQGSNPGPDQGGDLGGDTRDDSGSLDDVEGFDLSLFTRLRPRSWPLRPHARGIVLRSDPVDLFAFAFDGSAPLSASASRTCRSRGGRVSGVLQWIAFDLDARGTYENRPDPAASSHWWLNYHPLSRARHTARGEAIDVHGWYDRADIALWID